MKKFLFVAALGLAVAGCEQGKSGSGSGTARDNTAVNERDRGSAAKTPIDQNENKKDVGITAEIRKRVVDTKMSIDAQNVKIITQDGRVTLRGPVKTADEKNQIETFAQEVAGAGNVDSQIEIEPAR
jgi:hyperosmotically inducible periplasmic protein